MPFGDARRRLVARTLAQQFAEHFETACNPRSMPSGPCRSMTREGMQQAMTLQSSVASSQSCMLTPGLLCRRPRRPVRSLLCGMVVWVCGVPPGTRLRPTGPPGPTRCEPLLGVMPPMLMSSLPPLKPTARPPLPSKPCALPALPYRPSGSSLLTGPSCFRVKPRPSPMRTDPSTSPAGGSAPLPRQSPLTRSRFGLRCPAALASRSACCASFRCPPHLAWVFLGIAACSRAPFAQAPPPPAPHGCQMSMPSKTKPFCRSPRCVSALKRPAQHVLARWSERPPGVCREARATVVLVRDLNLDPVRQDDRRIEAIANGLPLWGGAQVAVDTTLVSPLTAAGPPRRVRGQTAGAALQAARRAKERTYPEFCRCSAVPTAAGSPSLRLKLGGAGAMRPLTSSACLLAAGRGLCLHAALVVPHLLRSCADFRRHSSVAPARWRCQR